MYIGTCASWTGIGRSRRFRDSEATVNVQQTAQCTAAIMAEPWTVSTELQNWAATERNREEVDELAALWKNLTDLYHANTPAPRRIVRPILSRPGGTMVGAFTPVMAHANLPMSDVEAATTRWAHQTVVDALPPFRSVSYTFHGRGIVIVAGKQFAGYAATSVNVLRQYNSDLPVEIWAKDADEEDPLWCEELQLQGIACRRISDYGPVGSLWDWTNPLAWLRKPVPWSPYQWKIMSILFSSFEEVLFLDADNIPVQDPAFLFDSDVYHEKGAILWPDYWPSIASHRLPYLIGLTDEDSNEMWHQQAAESGQMLWNKRIHWRVSPHATYARILVADATPPLEPASCLLLQLPRPELLVYSNRRERSGLG